MKSEIPRYQGVQVSFCGVLTPSPQSPEIASACTLNTDTVVDALNRTHADCVGDSPCSTDLMRALDDALFVLNERKLAGRNTIDIASLNSWLEEQRLTATAAGAGLAMGVNVPLSAIRIPLRTRVSCSSKTKASVDDMEVWELVMVVERHIRSTGAISDFASNMTVEDAFVFLHGWLSGQLDLQTASGTFHIDGHTGNVLVNGSAHPGHPEHQFRRTIESIADLGDRHAALQKVTKALRSIANATYLRNHSKVRGVLEGVLGTLESHPLMTEPAVLARMGGRRMEVRVSRLEVGLAQLGQRIADLNASHSQLALSHSQLALSFSQRALQIAVMQAQLADLLKRRKPDDSDL